MACELLPPILRTFLHNLGTEGLNLVDAWNTPPHRHPFHQD
jgi:hypothetical protein